jgi:hypothetical protein|nr:hypothetical protein [Neorhizobium tomejilense]
MGYVADFVTGRSIAEREPAVGVVIVPRTGGWPDPVKAAALDPVHAHDRFSPLSLPLGGRINDRGFFEPTPKQFALDIFLKTTGFASWEKFFDSAYAGHEKGGVVLQGETKGAGFAVMRPETYSHVVQLGRRGQTEPDSPLNAARILIDAQRRSFENREDAPFLVALLANPPRQKVWTTLDGEEITVPHCSLGLADGYPWELEYSARDFIREQFKDAYKKPIEDTVPLFASLSDFQNLSRGLSDLGKYFTPGGFMRHDNVRAVTGLAISTLNGALSNASKRDYTGVEYREERFLSEMENVSRQLEVLQVIIRNEIEYARGFLGMDDPEEAAAPAPRSPMR